MQPELYVLLIGFPLLYVLFLWWYRGSHKPLTDAETDRLLAAIKGSASHAGEHDPDIIAAFQELVKDDDGKQFYMVNLLKFREKAVYPEGHEFDEDPLAANQRYSKIVLPALLKRGSHPVFMATVQGRFLHPAGSEAWDQVGMVRYRSRRDMLKMAAEVAAKGGDVHKWAALETTHVFPTKPVLNLISVRLLMAAVLALLCGVITLIALTI